MHEDDVTNRTRLLQVENSKRAVESELETTRRRLEQAEGGREALLSQIGKITVIFFSSAKNIFLCILRLLDNDIHFFELALVFKIFLFF